MSARREWNGGAFITGRDAANAADFMTKTASSFEPDWKDPSHWRVVYPADIGEALSVVEDLWLRIARHPAVRSTVLTDASTQECIVMFRPTGGGRDSECCQLLAAASIQESYGWRQDGGHGSLVSDIQWAGDTLLIELTSPSRMQRWPEGEAVEWAVQRLLQRVKQQGRKP
jgi:hypothetical protein